MARIEKTVFISYRRADVYTALAVYQDLTNKGYDVFFDYTSISSGDFEQIIVSNIKARAHFLLILTPTALDRCSEPGDWLRREIETAIDEQRNIIPLFFKGFNFGSPSVSEKLTGKLGNLGRFNGLNVHEDYFQAAMDRLSGQFLSVPLEAILQPYSTKVRERVKEEQIAAENALEQKWEEIKEIFKPAKEKAGGSEKDQIEKTKNTPFSLSKSGSPNLRLYRIGAGILLVAALGLAGLNAWVNRGNEITPTMTSQAIENTIGVEPSSTSPVHTVTVEIQSTTPPEEPMLTITPSPALDIGSTKSSPRDGMVQLYVPAGKFIMGSDDGADDERPSRSVDLDAFWIDQTEVTNAMYAMCVGVDACNEPSNTRYYSNTSYSKHPVVYVSWNDAIKYCSWAERKLPTEAEWEKAARGKNARIYPWGNDSPDETLLNYYGNIKDTTEVGKYPNGASPYGVLDMAGNVWEWVNLETDGNEDLSASGTRVVRGGAWDDVAYTVRSANREEVPPLPSKDLGFRCAQDTAP